MYVSKTVYSEKLGKNLDVRLFENKCGFLPNQIVIEATVFTDKKPEEIGSKQVHVLQSSSEKVFEKTYFVKDDENKFVDVLEKVIVDCETKVSIDNAAVEKFNKRDENVICDMIIDFKNRIEKLENSKADKVSGEDAIKTLIANMKKMGIQD